MPPEAALPARINPTPSVTHLLCVMGMTLAPVAGMYLEGHNLCPYDTGSAVGGRKEEQRALRDWDVGLAPLFAHLISPPISS